MQQTQAHIEDQRLFSELQRVGKGSALIRFEDLRWNEYAHRHNSGQADPKRVERIRRILQRTGCHPMQVGNHIPAIVNNEDLLLALHKARREGILDSDVLPARLSTIVTKAGYPELKFQNGIECLRGFHRVEAAKGWLPPSEKWWIIDLYLSDISNEAKIFLSDEYLNEQRPCDGMIYRRIQEYERAACTSLEMLWRSRLLERGEKNLRSLLNDVEPHKRKIAAGFNALTPFTGVFDSGMMTTTLHKAFASGALEELAHGLDKIRLAWCSFLRNVDRGPARIDQETAKVAELRAPGVSTFDAAFLRGRVLGGMIFGAFTSREREMIWTNMVSFKDIIPSLSKFFRDVHLLQLCTDALKWLIDIPRGSTLYSSFMVAYKADNGIQYIQTSEGTVRVLRGNRNTCSRLGYLGLIIYAMRHFRDLPRQARKKGSKAVTRAKVDCHRLTQFASLAGQLGFDTPQIKKLQGDIAPLPVKESRPRILITSTTGSDERINDRSGIPSIIALEDAKQYLFLDNLYQDQIEDGEGLTSFFILRSWFNFFFELPDLNSQDHRGARQEPSLLEESHPDMTFDAQEKNGPESAVEIGDAWRPNLCDDQATIPPANIHVDRGIDDIITTLGKTDQVVELRKFPIQFVELENGSLSRSEGEITEVSIVEGDPDSCISQKVRELLDTGRRACDNHGRYLPADDCYKIATQEMDNTVFYISEVNLRRASLRPQEPTSLAYTGKLDESHTPTTRDVGERSMHFGNYREHSPADGWGSDFLHGLRQQEASSHVHGGDKVTIHLKRRKWYSVGETGPEWELMDSLEIVNGDAMIVDRRLKNLWQDEQLKPHDVNLRVIESGDCYEYAKDAPDRALYMLHCLEARGHRRRREDSSCEQDLSATDTAADNHRHKITRRNDSQGSDKTKVQETLPEGGRWNGGAVKLGISSGPSRASILHPRRQRGAFRFSK